MAGGSSGSQRMELPWPAPPWDRELPWKLCVPVQHSLDKRLACVANECQTC